MDYGYIMMQRELIYSPIWNQSTSDQKSILITIITLANYKENSWEWNGKDYKLMPGQCVTSIRSIMDTTGKGITIQNVRTALNRFKKLGILTYESNNKGLLITMLNWNKYQGENKPLIVNDPNKNNTKEPKTIHKEAKNDTNIDKVKEAWNSLNVSLIKAINPNSTRLKALNARIREYGVEGVLEAIENIKHNPFYTGKNDRAWTITFDWFLKPNNFIKILELERKDNCNKSTNNTTNTSTYTVNQDEIIEKLRYEAAHG